MKKIKYDISKPTAPAMPRLGKGTECVKLLLSQVSKDMHEPMVPMLFPILGAQISESKFQYPDLSWKEMCGMMANLVADSGCNKGQLSNLVEAICRDFRQHDDEELSKLVDWQRQINGKFHHTPLHQEGARPALLPLQQPTHGCKAPHGVAHPLPAAHGRTAPAGLSVHRQDVYTAPGAMRRRPPGRAPGEGTYEG